MAETLSDAVAMSRKNGGRVRIVTLDGQLINAGGSMTGSSAAKNAGILSQRAELERLQADRSKLAKQRDELAAKAEDLSASWPLRAELDSGYGRAAKYKQRAGLAQGRTAHDGKCRGSARAAPARNIGRQRDAGEGACGHGGQGRERKARAGAARGADSGASRKGLGDRDSIAEATQKKLEVEGERTRTDKAVQEKNNALLDMERSCSASSRKNSPQRWRKSSSWTSSGTATSSATAQRRRSGSP